jgi:signal transduction histidine kinase
MPLRWKGLLVAILPTLPMLLIWALIILALVQAASDTVGVSVRARDIQAALLRVETAVAQRRAAVLGGADAASASPDDLDLIARRLAHDDGRAALATLRQALAEEAVALSYITSASMAPTEALRSESEAYTDVTAATVRLRTSVQDWLAATTASSQRRNRLVFWGFIGGSVVAVVGGLWLALYLMRDITRRLEHVVRGADAAVAHRAVTLPDLGHDDIGVLGRRIGEMFAQLREREADLAARNRDLDAVNKELETFSYSVSHDLRAPLRAIAGFSQIIEEDSGERLDAGARDALRRVRAAAERMGQLIDQLLRLSRLSRAPLSTERVDVTAMAMEIVAALRESDPGRQVDVEIEPGIVADADPALLQVALDNLLSNAWKYTRHTAAPRVTVTTARTADGTAVIVNDNGAGFDMTHAGLLFGAFQRLHTQKEFEGIGVGLATVQRIAHRHGGRVSGEGRPGAGATFTLLLPATGVSV